MILRIHRHWTFGDGFIRPLAALSAYNYKPADQAHIAALHMHLTSLAESKPSLQIEESGCALAYGAEGLTTSGIAGYVGDGRDRPLRRYETISCLFVRKASFAHCRAISAATSPRSAGWQRSRVALALRAYCSC